MMKSFSLKWSEDKLQYLYPWSFLVEEAEMALNQEVFCTITAYRYNCAQNATRKI